MSMIEIFLTKASVLVAVSLTTVWKPDAFSLYFIGFRDFYLLILTGTIKHIRHVSLSVKLSVYLVRGM